MELSLTNVITVCVMTNLLVSVSCNPVPNQWSECTVTCGGGTQSWVDADGVTNSRECNTNACPVNGGWSDYRLLRCVDTSCRGPTTVVNVRSCNNPSPRNGGSMCRGASAIILTNTECPKCINESTS